MATPSGAARRGSIFVSYRREDTKHLAGRIYDHLVERFPDANIFMDVDSIEPGVDFAEAIEKAVASCEILLAVIGKGWLDARDEDGGRRLEDPDDFVFLEITAALKRGIRVLPVLVDGVPPPRTASLPVALAPLARRNAIRLDHETFRSDLQAMIAAVARVLQDVTPAAAEPEVGNSQPSESQDSPPIPRIAAKLLSVSEQYHTIWTVELTADDKRHLIIFDHSKNTRMRVFVDGQLVVDKRVIVTLERSSSVILQLDNETRTVAVQAVAHFTWTTGRITRVEFQAGGAISTVQAE